jgi:hypothetical protein
MLTDHELPPSSLTLPAAGGRGTCAPRRVRRSAWGSYFEAARAHRLRSLFVLFVLYAAALLGVSMIEEGADIGCILGGIAGHVLYATHRLVGSWRDAAALEDAKARAALALRPRFA